MNKRITIKTRRWTAEDIPGVIACQRAAYPDFMIEDTNDQRAYELQFSAFPEGQFLAEADGKIVGYTTSIIVQLDEQEHFYTYSEITGASSFATHNPMGDTLYGADIAVHPDYQQMGVSKLLYKERVKLLQRYNLRRLNAHGRIPGYKDYAGKMSAKDYVKEVEQGHLQDSALSAHLSAGYQVKQVLYEFVADESSMNYCTWIEMLNPRFKPEKRKVAPSLRREIRKIRVCAAQYLMRPIQSWEEFEQNVEFFVDTAESYHCHFLIFPELFTAQLFSTMPHEWDDHQAIHALEKMRGKYIELFKRKAIEHKLYIIAGSHPVLREDGKMYNTAHLFSPKGSVYTQDKLHITSGERNYWNIHPGEGIHIFDTPLARIAIQVCYDIEFPEISRLLTLAGVEAIFVPFSTDERKSYNRVRYSAQARAVENYIYVVIAGNVGNLSNVKSYLLNYGQAAVFTPSDFAFPLQGILGEAEPNIETVVISELDLNTLAQQRESGSVRPLYDRRTDLYEIKAKTPVKIVRTD